jgi:hypothetical protein
MKLTKNSAVRIVMTFIAFSWTISPSLLKAAEATSASPASLKIDPTKVYLTESGSLQGTVMSPGGKPAANKPVVLGKNSKAIGRVSTDANGAFSFPKVPEGEYQLATGDSVALVECHDRSKPVEGAVPSVLMSQEAMLARGHIKDHLFHPLFVGLVVAAAIAIPIAIAANDDDAS